MIFLLKTTVRKESDLQCSLKSAITFVDWDASHMHKSRGRCLNFPFQIVYYEAIIHRWKAGLLCKQASSDQKDSALPSTSSILL